MRRYSIGDVSRALGLTPGALHFYEREGIIQPPKERDGGRRYYTQVDLIRLLSCRKYRAMDVPLKTIAQQFSSKGDPLPVISARLAQMRDQAQRKAAYYRQLATDIDLYAKAIESLAQQEGRFRVRSSPEVAMLRLGGGLLSNDKAEQALVQRWLEAMPATRIAIALSEDALSAEYCYTVDYERAQALGLLRGERAQACVRRLEDSMCISTVLSDERMHEEPMCAFEPVLAYMRTHGFERTGTAWASLIVVDCSKGTRKTYTEVFVPFV